jgi:hypothetical protein
VRELLQLWKQTEAPPLSEARERWLQPGNGHLINNTIPNFKRKVIINPNLSCGPR